MSAKATAWLRQCSSDFAIRSAGKGITVTGKNITASGPLGEHVLGTLYVIDPAGGNGDILGCGGQGAWGFDYGGKDKDAYFNGKTQQVNGKLSVRLQRKMAGVPIP